MDQSWRAGQIGRRLFLRGAVAAGLATGLVRSVRAESIHRPAGVVATPRIAVLVPGFSGHEHLAESLTTGLGIGAGEGALVSYFRSSGLPSRLESEVERLLQIQRVDFLVTYASENGAAALAAIVADHNLDVIVLDPGVDYWRGELAPGIRRISGFAAASAWHAGYWAASSIGRRAVVAGSFREAGYDSFAAYGAGFEAGGGEVAAWVVTGAPGNETSLADIARLVHDSDASVVLAAYTGDDAVDFFRASAGAPTVGTPLLTEPWVLERAGEHAFESLTVGPTVDGGQLPDIERSFRDRTGRAIDPFGLLGFAAGRLARRLGSETPGAEQTLLSGDRFRVSTFQQAGGSYRHVQLAEITGHPIPQPVYPKTGWIVPYLAG